MSVKRIVNSMSSGCKNCMVLMRKIVMAGLIDNVRIFAKFVPTKKNYYADALSRFQGGRLRKLATENNKEFDAVGEEIPEDIWPPQKIWVK